MPGGMEVKVASIEKLEDYEQPLAVNFTVKGGIGSSTGKRILLPADIFEVNSKPSFPHRIQNAGLFRISIPVPGRRPHQIPIQFRVLNHLQWPTNSNFRPWRSIACPPR